MAAHLEQHSTGESGDLASLTQEVSDPEMTSRNSVVSDATMFDIGPFASSTRSPINVRAGGPPPFNAVHRQSRARFDTVRK